MTSPLFSADTKARQVASLCRSRKMACRYVVDGPSHRQSRQSDFHGQAGRSDAGMPLRSHLEARGVPAWSIRGASSAVLHSGADAEGNADPVCRLSESDRARGDAEDWRGTIDDLSTRRIPGHDGDHAWRSALGSGSWRWVSDFLRTDREDVMVALAACGMTSSQAAVASQLRHDDPAAVRPRGSQDHARPRIDRRHADLRGARPREGHRDCPESRLIWNLQLRAARMRMCCGPLWFAALLIYSFRRSVKDDTMQLPHIKHIVTDPVRNIRFVIMAYRRLTGAEASAVVRYRWTCRPAPKPDRIETIYTAFGAEPGL